MQPISKLAKPKLYTHKATPCFLFPTSPWIEPPFYFLFLWFWLLCEVKVVQLCPILRDPVDYIVHGILQARLLEWVPFPSPGDLPNPGIKPRSPTLRADSLPAEPQGKPKNTGVGSLFLLQRIFLTQESNWGLLHCRRILYQLSYQGSPDIITLWIF